MAHHVIELDANALGHGQTQATCALCGDEIELRVSPYSRAALVRLASSAVKGLSVREAEVLGMLIHAHGEYVTVSQIIDALYGADVPDAGAVYMLVKRLRRKLRSSPWRIDNLHGIGYCLVRTGAPDAE